MEDFLVPLGLFAMIAYIAKVIGDTRVRRKVLDSHVEAGVAEQLLNRKWSEPSTRSALKWGLVILSLGVGVLLVDLLTVGFESPLAYAILLLATGIALLGFYAIEREQDGSTSSDRVSASDAGMEKTSEPVHDPEV